MRPYIKILGSIALSASLLYIGFHFFLTAEQQKLFFTIPLYIHLISMLIVTPISFFGGIELKILYQRISKIKLTVYDTLTMPLVLNLWGFLIPFQGAFIYTATYIVAKYKKNISDSLTVYVVSFSISLAFAGAVGILYSFYNAVPNAVLFRLACLILIINPFVLYLINRYIKNFNEGKFGWINWIIFRLGKFTKIVDLNLTLVSYLVLINLATVICTALWSYWICAQLHISLSFAQLILISLLMKLTLLVKITPGNIGFTQFASGGIAVLVGGKLNDGFLLSAFQYVTVILVAFTLGTIFTALNAKYFTWADMKGIFIRLRE